MGRAEGRNYEPQEGRELRDRGKFRELQPVLRRRRHTYRGEGGGREGERGEKGEMG